MLAHPVSRRLQTGIVLWNPPAVFRDGNQQRLAVEPFAGLADPVSDEDSVVKSVYYLLAAGVTKVIRTIGNRPFRATCPVFCTA